MTGDGVRRGTIGVVRRERDLPLNPFLKCWLVVEPWPLEDLRSGNARAVPRFTVHSVEEEQAETIVKRLGVVLGGGAPTQIGYQLLEGCSICQEPDDDISKPATRAIEILTPKGWAPHPSPERTER